MPGKIVKVVLGRGGRGDKPPEKGSADWTMLVNEMVPHVRDQRPFCALGGGRRKDGWPCESQYTMSPSGLCRKHGGNNKRGAEHHFFVDGRSTGLYKKLPARFREAYMASLKDDDLLSMRADIAVSDARMEELASRLDTGESGDRWGQIAVVADSLLEEADQSDPKVDRFRNLALELNQLCSAQYADDRSWRDLKATSQHRRKLVDTERQRLKDLQAFMTAEECLAIVARIADSIVRHVDDKRALTAILAEIQASTGGTDAERGRLEIVR